MMLGSRKTLGVLAALLFSFSIIGCGGSSSHKSSSSPASATTGATAPAAASTVGADAYVSAVCTAVIPFEKDVQQRSGALDLSAGTSPAEGKRALQSFMSAAVSDAGHAVTQLQAAGAPSVANGKAVAGAILSAFTQLKTVLAKAAADTAQLPTSSPAAFKSAADAISTSVKTSVGAIGGSLSGLKSPELEKAAKSAPSCKSLGS